MSTKILLIGSGGREHALAWKLAESPLVSQIVVVPGNGGTSTIGPKVTNETSVSQDDFAGLLKLAVERKIDLVVPGPEVPLVNGVTDYFRENGLARIRVFGPNKTAAQMEGSKAFAKDFMHRHHIPTAAYKNFTDHAVAKSYIDSHPNMKFVIKASGLAAGKGVIIPNSREEAYQALASIMLDREFGAAGDHVVIEEFLEGDELSVLSFSDGYSIKSLPAAQDHKTIFDGDAGPNTGGMGAYAPTALGTPAVMDRIHREVLQPTIDGMRAEKMPFVGCLFTGFMMTREGPKVLEYNVRFGDPETQTLLPLLESDLAAVMLACTNGYLSGEKLELKPGFSATVVAAAGGYPGKYDKGTPIMVQAAPKHTFHFHAGTTLEGNTLKTAGGRVIASTALGYSIHTAVQSAYEGMKCITFDNMHFRKDIAHRALKGHHSGDDGVSKWHKKAPLTYAASGVSVDSGNSLVQKIKPYVRSTARPGASAIIGGFGGEIDLAEAGFSKDSPRIVAAIDGIGTKILIAKAVGVYDTVGVDLVAMNVNDLIVQGAEPLAFLDYYACSELNVEHAAAFVRGVAQGCKESGCALVGGETAEMPSVYQRGDFDAAGCAIGALPPGRKMLPHLQSMRAGDVLIGLPSNGVHSNGFSLVRRIIERAGLSFSARAPWDTSSPQQQQTVAQSLLTPTALYVKSILKVLAADQNIDSATPRIKGMAHITGGGLIDNIPRMLPAHLAAVLQVGSWPMPSVFKWLKTEGGLLSLEFARTFNCGLGMVIVAQPEASDDLLKEFSAAGQHAVLIGHLKEKESAKEEVVLEGIAAWDNF